jgi:hypothetical protein
MKTCRLLAGVLSVCLIWNVSNQTSPAFYSNTPKTKNDMLAFFTENIGQWNPQIRFMTSMGPYHIYFLEKSLVVYNQLTHDQTRYMIDSPDIQILGREILDSSSSFFYGQKVKQWKSNAKHFAKLLHQSQTNGTSIEYYISSKGLTGTTRQTQAMSSSLEIEVYSSNAFQQTQKKILLDSKDSTHLFVALSEKDQAPPKRHSQEYESSNLFYSSYFGGSVLDETIKIHQGRDQSLYVTGYTYSVDFPLHSSGNPSTWNGWCDIFLMKWNLNTRKLLFSVLIGGSMIDRPVDMKINQKYEVFLTGYTYSDNFPCTSDAYQKQNKGKKDIFCIKLNEWGNEMIFSTLLGGSGDEQANSMVLDDSNNIILTGSTKSEDFPVSSGAHQRLLSGSSDVFFLKLNPRGSHVLYSTYIGGLLDDEAETVLIGEDNKVYLAGITYSNSFLNHFREASTGETLSGDIFLLEIHPNNYQLSLCDIFGGSSLERVVALSIDSKGLIWLGGNTFSPDFTADYSKVSSHSAFPAIFLSSWDSRKKSKGLTYLFSGSQKDFLRSMLLQDDSFVYLAGLSYSKDLFLATDLLPPYGNEAGDGFLFKLNLTTSEVEFSTYWGGEGFDEITSICALGNNYVWVAGTTSSTQFPVTLTAYQPYLTGQSNGFLSEILCVPKAKKPELLYPENNKTEVPLGVDFVWNPSSIPVRYRFILYDSHFQIVCESEAIEENYFTLATLLQADTYYHWMVHLINEANLITASDLWRFKTEKEITSMNMVVDANKKKHHLNDQIYLKVCLNNTGNTPLSELTLRLQHPDVFQVNELLPRLKHQIEAEQVVISLPDFPYRGHLVLQVDASLMTEVILENKLNLKFALYQEDTLLGYESLELEILP